MKNSKANRIRHLIAIVAIFSGLVASGTWLINRPATLRYALKAVNSITSVKIEAQNFRWNPLSSRVSIESVSLENAATGKKASVERIALRYRLLGLLRGKFVIDRLTLDNVHIELPYSELPKQKTPHKRINIARLVLLKSMELIDGRVRGLSLKLGKASAISADEMRFALVPGLFGKSQFALHGNGAVIRRYEHDMVSAGMLSLKTSTELPKWRENFPYLNAFSGAIKLQDFTVEGVTANDVEADITYKDDELKLDGLSVNFDARKISGRLSANTADQIFDLALEIPKPIPFPYIGKKLETIDTAGELSGKIELSGNGFVPRETDGHGRVEFIHRLDVAREAPISFAADLAWKNGVVKLANVSTLAGTDSCTLDGEIDIPNKHISISAKGSRFPAEHVFDIFRNKHLRKIFGPSDFEASFEGWPQKFKLHVVGTTYDGGWMPINAGRIESVLDLTYDDLHLTGKIFTKGHESGAADLSIKFGPKMRDVPRSKFIELTAEAHDVDLAESMGSLGLSGTGKGTLTLRGPHTSFTGKAHAEMEKAGWHGVPFEKASTDIDITHRKLTFDNIELTTSGTDIQKASAPLIADISEGIFKLHGEPFAGLSIDATYRSEGSRWSIAKISWNDTEDPGKNLLLAGSLGSGGAMDLRINGVASGRILPVIAKPVRDAQGDFDINLILRGTSADPHVSGSIKLASNSLRLKNPRISLTNLNGELRFEGPRIFLDDITAEIEDGNIKINGHVDHKLFKPYAADLSLTGSSMRFRTADRSLNLELDAMLKLVGLFPNPLLSGDIRILEGKYTKDFYVMDVLSDSFTIERPEIKNIPLNFVPRLDLKIRNTGDLAIRNNVGDIWLNTNIDVKGTRERPDVTGSIDVTDGEIHYLGLNFDITKGFMDFRGETEKPYLEVNAQKELNTYNVTLVLHGYTDNLALDLSATSPQGALEKKDVISLLLFGATEQERLIAERSGSMLSTSMVAQSVSGILEQPVSKLAHLDVFRLEASDPTTHAISRLNIGKQVSDRLTVKFATDINRYNSVQTFSAEYLITDGLLLRGTRSTDGNYQISGLLRFRMR